MKHFLTPHNTLLAISSGLVLFVLGVVFLAMESPWLGLSLEASDKGVMISHVHADSPAFQAGLKPGVIIQSLATADGNSIQLNNEDLIFEPDDYSSYQEYFSFFQKQSRIYQIMLADELYIKTGQGDYALKAEAYRPLGSLPFYFWLQLLSGFSIVVMGALVWVYSHKGLGPSLYLFAAIGLLIAIAPSAIYTTRELAMDGELFLALSRINQLGVMLFCSLGTSIFWYYPKPINNFPFVIFALLMAMLFLLLNYAQFYQSLDWAVRMPVLFWLALDISLGIIQWRRSRHNPVARAQVKWFVMAWIFGPIIYVSLNVLPLVVGMEPVLTQKTGWVLFVFVYLGIAFGITRYRLFDLDRWVLHAWFWFFCGLGFILIDLALVAITGINQIQSLMIVLAVTGWIYFPLRQLSLDKILARRFGRDNNQLLVAMLQQILSQAPLVKAEILWPDLLVKMFDVLQIEKHCEIQEKKLTIENDGLSILIPALPGGCAYRIHYAQKGARLFSPEDVELIEAVWRIYKHVLEFQQAQMIGARKERKRLARDLHDDVSARILSLVYRAENEDNAEFARDTLSELRNVIHDLDSGDMSLYASLGEWKREMQRRCGETQLDLNWRQGVLPDTELYPLHRSNMRKILREIFTNIIKHARADRVDVDITCDQRLLVIRVADNGTGFIFDSILPGTGLKNIQRRANEMDGDLIIDTAVSQGTAIEVSMFMPQVAIKSET